MKYIITTLLILLLLWSPHSCSAQSFESSDNPSVFPGNVFTSSNNNDNDDYYYAFGGIVLLSALIDNDLDHSGHSSQSSIAPAPEANGIIWFSLVVVLLLLFGLRPRKS